MQCNACKNFYYKIIIHKCHILGSITIAKQLGNGHEVAKANQVISWKMDPIQFFNCDWLRFMLERKYKNISMDYEDARPLATTEWITFLNYWDEIKCKGKCVYKA